MSTNTRLLPSRRLLPSLVAGLAAVLFAGLGVAPAAAADQDVTTQTLTQTDAPISIDKCQGYLHQNGDFVDEDADFTIKGDQGVTAVRLLFDYYSPFGNHLGSQFGTITGTWKAGTSVKGNGWQSANQWAVVYAVRCSVDAVKFADGSSWSSPGSVAGTSSASTGSTGSGALNGGASGHPATCNVELIDRSRIDIPWDNPGCAKARAAWLKTHTSAAPAAK
ncbi:MAG: hypothetical protein ACLPSH_00015 [Vulcanimicrobiaceae bacterium]|jgi:hypothetical protein